MKIKLTASEELTGLTSFLTAFAVLAGLSTFLTIPLTLMEGISNWWITAVCAVFSIGCALAAWSLRRGKSWAFAFTAGFLFLLALVFPIGTVLAYVLFIPLWRSRAGLIPFINRSRL